MNKEMKINNELHLVNHQNWIHGSVREQYIMDSKN